MSELVVRHDDDHNEFMSLYKAARHKNAIQKQGDELRMLLAEHPDLVKDTISMAHMVIEDFINVMHEKKSDREIVRAEIDAKNRYIILNQDVG